MDPITLNRFDTECLNWGELQIESDEYISDLIINDTEVFKDGWHE